ncbi:hypothetical protein [Martelella sp. AMO21009]
METKLIEEQAAVCEMAQGFVFADQKEGMAAFFEKRAAQFNHR